MIPRRLGNVYHLPAYAAVGRWVAGRRVVVVEPDGAEGPLRLVAGDARRVIVVGELPDPPRDVQVRAGVPELPFADDEVDVVACLEPYATYPPSMRRRLLREAHRILRTGGLFAAWVPRQPAGDEAADFWALETELSEVFRGSTMIAQMPWQGVSLAPVLDDDRVPSVTLEEALLDRAPEATHYLAFGFVDRPPFEMVEQMRSECLLIPVPGAEVHDAAEPVEPEPIVAPEAEEVGAAVETARARVAELEEQLKSRDEDIGGLSKEVETLEGSLAQATDQAETRGRELDALTKTRGELQRRCEQLEHRITELEATRDELSARSEIRAEQAAKADADREAWLDERQKLEVRAREAVRQRDESAHALATIEDQLAAATVERDEVKARANALQAQLRDAVESREEAERQAEALQAQLRKATESWAEAERQAEALNAELRDAAAARAGLEHEAEALERKVAERDAERDAERTELESKAEALSKEVAEATAARDEQESIARALQVKVGEATTARDHLQERVAALSDQVRDAIEQRKSLQAKLDAGEEQARETLAVRTELDKRCEALEARVREATAARDDLQRRADANAQQAAAANEAREALARRCEALELDLREAVSARDSQGHLAERVESELADARQRLMSANDQLAERSAEASRLAGELQAVRERLTDQQAALDQTRTRAEELSRTAARQDEQGRTLSEVAADRDRLREELKRRSATIGGLEERLWGAREEVQKERLEVVRLSGDVARLKEQAERAHEAEQDGRKRVEALSAEVRAAELARADAEALLRGRDEQVARLEKDAEALSLESADLDLLRQQLAERGRELAQATSQLEQARSRAAEATQRIKRRDEQLSQAGTQLEDARRRAEAHETEAVALRGELDVKSLEIEQLAASVANLHAQLDEQRKSRRHSDDTTSDLQRRLEQATEELDQLRNRLRQRDQELADVVSAKETHGVELYKLRQELEAASHVNEQLEEALRIDPEAGRVPAQIGWPDDAVDDVRRLRAQLAAQTRRHAEQLARIEREREPSANTDELHAMARRAELEADVRAEEQEQLLALLESAEQRIWEMNDAADRNAARLAASLAQLEKHKELIDETLDELEVTRKQLAAAQTRALEQERLVASERAKLVRAGIDPDGVQATADGEHEDPFADLNPSELMIELHVTPDKDSEAGSPAAAVSDRQGSSARSEGPRIVVEAVDDDEEWDDSQEVTVPSARRGTSPDVLPRRAEAGTPTAAPDEVTMPRLRLPNPPKVGETKPKPPASAKGSGSAGS